MNTSIWQMIWNSIRRFIHFRSLCVTRSVQVAIVRVLNMEKFLFILLSVSNKTKQSKKYRKIVWMSNVSAWIANGIIIDIRARITFEISFSIQHRAIVFLFVFFFSTFIRLHFRSATVWKAYRTKWKIKCCKPEK